MVGIASSNKCCKLFVYINLGMAYKRQPTMKYIPGDGRYFRCWTKYSNEIIGEI